MTSTMQTLVKRAERRLQGLPTTLELKTQPEHHAFCLAWRTRSKSSRWAGRWRGPGTYRFDGFYDDGRVAVATVEWEAPPTQMTLGL